MIWNDAKLREWCEQYQLVTPYRPEQINPASIDLRIGRFFIDLISGRGYQEDELDLYPGDAILATTLEYVRIPSDACAAIYLKSSMARTGLDHALAGWVDPGFQGQLTLELHAHRPITLRAHTRVVQMVVMQLVAPAEQPYNGRYQGQVGPTPAREG